MLLLVRCAYHTKWMVKDCHGAQERWGIWRKLSGGGAPPYSYPPYSLLPLVPPRPPEKRKRGNETIDLIFESWQYMHGDQDMRCFINDDRPREGLRSSTPLESKDLLL